MDLSSEKLESLAIQGIQKESISILKLSPKTFYLITLILIFPFSFAILAYPLFIDTYELFNRLFEYFMGLHPSPSDAHNWTRLLIYHFYYFIFLFSFSLLSIAAVVFTVACLYTSKPVFFSSTLHAMPKVFKRLFITFLWVFILMFLTNLVLTILFCAFFVFQFTSVLLSLLSFALFVFFYILYSHIFLLWHLANVVSVLEPLYGLAAIKKSYELLKGKFRMASMLVQLYFANCIFIWFLFDVMVALDVFHIGFFTRIVLGMFLNGLLAIVNLVGLLVQSVLYYYCKSYHHQGIDKSELHDLLGGYLGEYVPLKSNIEMESLDTIVG